MKKRKNPLFIVALCVISGVSGLMAAEEIDQQKARIHAMLKALDGVVLDTIVEGRSVNEDNLPYVRRQFSSALEAVKSHVSLLTKADFDVLEFKERELALKRMQIFQDILESEQSRLKEGR